MVRKARQRNGRGSKLELLKRVVHQIVEGVHPEKIILFGSHAYGRPTKDSDIDLLIVMKSRRRPVERAVEVSKSIRFYPFPMDILVRTPQEIRHRTQMGDPFFEEVLSRGKILYES